MEHSEPGETKEADADTEQKKPSRSYREGEGLKGAKVELHPHLAIETISYWLRLKSRKRS